MSKSLPREIVHQSADVVGSALDALPSEVPGFVPDLGDVSDAVGDIVSTVAVTGGRGIFRVVRTVRRHPRGAGTVLLVVLTALGVAAFMKKRNAPDPQPVVAR